MENIYLATGQSISNQDVIDWNQFIIENLDEETVSITFDFKNLTYPVSSFFGMVFSLHKFITISKFDATVKIVNCSRETKELLRKLNFYKVAELCL